jgi:hypothetical protein
VQTLEMVLGVRLPRLGVCAMCVGLGGTRIVDVAVDAQPAGGDVQHARRSVL